MVVGGYINLLSHYVLAEYVYPCNVMSCSDIMWNLFTEMMS